MDQPNVWKRLRALDADVTRLGHIAALLEWDQETYLPEAAVEERAAQIALIVGLHHDRIVAPEWGELFAELDNGAEVGADGDEVRAAFLREARKRWTKKTKVPRELVEDIARESSLAQAAWAAARRNDDFSSFAPHLEKIVGLERAYAEAVAPDADPYDTLLDEYEPGATGDEIASVFDELGRGLSSLLGRIRSGREPDSGFLDRSYPVAEQDAFGRSVQEFMGYDERRGRLDLSAHPFTTTLGPDDVRVTTRYDEDNVLSGLFSNIHEAGHGLYEQGMGDELRASLLADGASLGIHESQSRFWENFVGRSRAFWDRWFPDFQCRFTENLKGVDAAGFFKAVNRVRPSLIRVDADEVTYSFHIIIRFRLERDLIHGRLAVGDLPEAWRTAYRDLLGITPPNDATGALQDVHWSVGLFGYFPTYALGNLYAAQFTQVMEQDLGPLDERIRNGDAGSILAWLRTHIHAYGRVYPPGELCRRVTGGDLDPRCFLEYLELKYADVYEWG